MKGAMSTKQALNLNEKSFQCLETEALIWKLQLQLRQKGVVTFCTIQDAEKSISVA